MFATGRKKPVVYATTESGCHVCTSHALNTNGYPRIKINGKLTTLAPIICAKTHGPIPSGHVVRHTCDNPLCINPAHLITGTHAENVADRVARGRTARGEKGGQSKLSEEQVRAVLVSTERHTVLAKRLGVSETAIRYIRMGRTWKQLANPS